MKEANKLINEKTGERNDYSTTQRNQVTIKTEPKHKATQSKQNITVTPSKAMPSSAAKWDGLAEGGLLLDCRYTVTACNESWDMQGCERSTRSILWETKDAFVGHIRGSLPVKTA